MRIALVIDNPKRDLKPLTLLATHLVFNGHEVYLTPMNLQVFEVERILPDIVMVAGFRREHSPARHFKKLGCFVIVLETEGGFIFNEDFLVSRIDTSVDANEIVDLFFCWGEKYKNLVLSETNIAKNKVHIVGHPRFGLNDNKQKEKGNKILFSPNFSYIQKGKLNTGPIIRDSELYNVNLMESFVDFDKYFYEFMDLVIETSKKYSNCVVYRPHPFDDIGFINKLFNGFDIEIDKNYSIDVSFSNSFVCVHNSSTTGFEALLNGIPSVIPRFREINWKSDEIDYVSEICNSPQEFFDKIDFLFANREQKKDYNLDELRCVVDFSINSINLITTKINELEYSNRIKNVNKTPVTIPMNRRITKFIKGLVQFQFKPKVLVETYYDLWLPWKRFSEKDILKLLDELNVNINSISVSKINGLKSIRLK